MSEPREAMNTVPMGQVGLVSAPSLFRVRLLITQDERPLMQLDVQLVALSRQDAASAAPGIVHQWGDVADTSAKGVLPLLHLVRGRHGLGCRTWPGCAP